MSDFEHRENTAGEETDSSVKQALRDGGPAQYWHIGSGSQPPPPLVRSLLSFAEQSVRARDLFSGVGFLLSVPESQGEYLKNPRVSVKIRVPILCVSKNLPLRGGTSPLKAEFTTLLRKWFKSRPIRRSPCLAGGRRAQRAGGCYPANTPDSNQPTKNVLTPTIKGAATLARTGPIAYHIRKAKFRPGRDPEKLILD